MINPPRLSGKQKLCRFWHRWKLQILCVAAGLFMYELAQAAGSSENGISEGYLERGDYGDSPVTYDFMVEGLGEEALSCQVEIQPVKYDEEEALKVFDNIIGQLPEWMKGENESLSLVRTDLQLPSDFSEYGVKVFWKSENPEWVDSFGQVHTQDCPEKGAEVLLKATLVHGDYEKEAAFVIRVYPEVFTPEERMAQELCRRIQKEDSRNPTEKEVELPKEYDGHILSYREKQDKDYRLFFILGPLAAFLLYVRERKQEEKEKKKRSEALMLDYADVVYQLMVFIGAGLTVGQAWERIVMNYKSRLESKRCQKRPVYEEMALALGQMQCGQSEGKVIMEFGKRCRLQPYLKLTTLLEQNRRTGTKNLQQVLEQEMISAWEQQKNVARRMGEEAGTKLLLPLFLMLFVVMVLVMVPAMMAMG